MLGSRAISALPYGPCALPVEPRSVQGDFIARERSARLNDYDQAMRVAINLTKGLSFRLESIRPGGTRGTTRPHL
jgi:hypothetical protein